MGMMVHSSVSPRTGQFTLKGQIKQWHLPKVIPFNKDH